MDPSKYPPWPGDDKASVLLDIVAKQNIDEVFKLCYLRRDMHEESIKVTGKQNFASTGWLPTIEQALSAKYIPGPRSDAPDIPPLGSTSISTYSGQAMGQKFTGEDTMRIVEAIPGEKYTLKVYVATTAPYGDKFKTIVKQSLVALPPDNDNNGDGNENTGSAANSSSSPTSSSHNTVTASNNTITTSTRTQYRVLVAPVFTSKVNGFIKGMIEKGVKDGTTRNFTDLAAAMAKFIEIESPEDAATAAAKRRKQASVETVTAAQHVAAQAQELLPFLDHFHPEVLFGSKSYAILLQWSVYLSQHEIGFDQRTNLFGLSVTSAFCIVYITLQLLLFCQTLLRRLDAVIHQTEWVNPIVYLVTTPIESMLSIIKLPENMSQLVTALFICIALKYFSNRYLIGLLPTPPAVPQPSDQESAAAAAAGGVGRGGRGADGSDLLLGEMDGQGIRYEGYNETMATVAAKLHKGANDFQMGAQGFKGALHAVRPAIKQHSKSRRHHHGRSGSGGGDGGGGSMSRHYGHHRNTNSSKERNGATLPPISSTYNNNEASRGAAIPTPIPPKQPSAAAPSSSSAGGDPVATIRDSIANFTQSIRDPFISHTTDHMKKKKVTKGLKKQQQQQQQPMHKRTSSKGSLTPELERCTSPMSDVDGGALSDGDLPPHSNNNNNNNGNDDGRKTTVSSFTAFSSQLLTKKLKDLSSSSRREHGPSSSSLPQLDSDGEEVHGDREGPPSSSNDQTSSRSTSMHRNNRAATNSPSPSAAAAGRSEQGEEEEVSSNSRHYTVNDNRTTTTTDGQGQLRMEDAVVEEVFENQRLQPFRGWGSTWPGHFLPTDKVSKYSSSSSSSYNTPSAAAAALGDGVTIGINPPKPNSSGGGGGMKVSQKFKQVAPSLPPQGWAWVDPAWKVDMSGLLTGGAVDQQGWSYALDFSRLSYPYLEGSGSKTFSDFVRQRRFIRTRARVVVVGRGGGGKSTQQQHQATTVLVGSLTETNDPGRAMSMLSDALALELGKKPQGVDFGEEEEDDNNNNDDDDEGVEMKVDDADFNNYNNNNNKASSSGSSCESPLQHLLFGDNREEDGSDGDEGGYISDNEEEEEEAMRRDPSAVDLVERGGGESG